MKMSFSIDQMDELERAARRHPDAHIRSRALAVRAVVLGHTRRNVAEMFPFSAYSIGQWVRRFQCKGIEAFEIALGRGRISLVDEQEVLSRLRRSPMLFGIEQTRWTLRSLRQACPSLSGMSERGILEVLHRLGFRYKRGQPWIHSPDPQYEVKKTPLKRLINKRQARSGR